MKLVKLKFWCELRFFGYPFDVQVTLFCTKTNESPKFYKKLFLFFKVCDFYLGSTWHHSEMMTFRLKKDIQTYFESSIESDSLQGTYTNLQYQFALERLERNITAKTGDDQSEVVKFSVVGFRLTLRRYYLQHIVSYYIPSLIFVMGSWISFVIPPGAGWPC